MDGAKFESTITICGSVFWHAISQVKLGVVSLDGDICIGDRRASLAFEVNTATNLEGGIAGFKSTLFVDGELDALAWDKYKRYILVLWVGLYIDNDVWALVWEERIGVKESFVRAVLVFVWHFLYFFYVNFMVENTHAY